MSGIWKYIGRIATVGVVAGDGDRAGVKCELHFGVVEVGRDAIEADGRQGNGADGHGQQALAQQ